MVIIKSNEIEEFASTFPERREELDELKDNYDKLVLKLNFVWEELKLRRPKNILPSEKKKYAMVVFEECARYGVNQFTGLYFGLVDGKISSIEEYIYNYDDKKLYLML
jgi:hypothetical protein